MGDPVEALRGTDLAALGDLASRLGVESFLLSRLGPGQTRLEPVAARWFAELRHRVALVEVNNLMRDEALAGMLSRLEAVGIDFILLKGAALRLLRPEAAGRFQCDVDILLRRPDLERAEAVLGELGFGLDESSRSRDAALETHFHFGFERDGAVVEVHWDVDRATPSGFLDQLWERSLVIHGSGGEARRILAPEHRLLFGCIHLSRHGFEEGLRWLADLSLELPLSAEEWERFVEDGRAWPWRAAHVPLWMLEVLGAPGLGDALAAEAVHRDGSLRLPERTLLRNLLVHLMMGEDWHGLPAWRAAKAVRAWLFSHRPLLAVLAENSVSGLGSRSQPAGFPPGSPQRLPEG
ncbi:MAG TPA: nucleotidyltransferase family protein [Thermoanaerobaculia bacterium]|nr:nucleotidyltransferase family protein [Thermoanaerobaculia bacterium]